MIQRAIEYITKATISDIDNINELICEMSIAHHEYDILSAKQELWFDRSKTEKYIELKKKKTEWIVKMTDTDIANEARLYALDQFWDYKETKATKSHYKNFLELLKAKKVELFTLNKTQV
jgi:beta-phosphoglucomutase-like phosphatase (HAD superfamily)